MDPLRIIQKKNTRSKSNVAIDPSRIMSETTFNESFKAEDNSRLRNHLFPALDESHSQDSLLSESIDDEDEIDTSRNCFTSPI